MTAPELAPPVPEREPAPGLPVVASPPGILRSILLVAQDFGRHVLVEPVRGGRLRPERWPRGLAPVGVVALSGYAVAVACVMLAGPLRAVLPLSVVTGIVDLTVPTLVIGPVFVLLVLALSLAQTAALHAPLWLAALVTLMSGLMLVSIGVSDTGLDQPVTAGRVASVVAALSLWALLLVRRRRRFAWGEFALVFLVMTVGIAVPLWAVSVSPTALGESLGLVLLSAMLQSMGALAAPVSLAAGAAVAQLACSMATESVASVRRRLPSVLGLVLLLALVVWRVSVAIQQLAAGQIDLAPLVSSVLLLAAVIGCWIGLARMRGSAASAQPAQLESRFGEIAQPVALFLTIGVFPATLVYVLSYVVYGYTYAEGPAIVFDAIGDAIASRTTIWVIRLIAGFVLLTLAVRAARRGRQVSPELFAAMGVVIAATSVIALVRLDDWTWTGQALTFLVTAAAVGLLAWWAVRRRLTADRGAAVGTALLIAALFDQRTFVEDPLKALFGFTGFAFVLFGFVWTLLTGAGGANRSSRRYPRSARVLFFLANSLFGVTVLAFAALARDPAFPIDVGPLTELGDQLLGAGLLAAALIAALAVAVRTPSGDPAANRPVDAAAE